MTVRARLAVALGVVVVLLALPSVYALDRLQELRDLTSELRERHGAAWVAVGELRTALSDLDRAQRSFVAAPDAASRDAVRRALSSADSALADLRSAGYGAAARGVASLLDQIRSGSRAIDSLVRQGDVEEATERFQEGKPRVSLARDSLTRVATLVDARSARAGRRARVISETASDTLLAALAGAGGVALLLALWITAYFTRPVLRLREATARIARGRLEPPGDLPYDRTDEVGELSRSFRAMTEKLAELNRLRAEFVGIASHKLKTPLNVISGYAQLLEEELGDRLEERHHELLAALQEQVRVLGRHVGRLLDLSRMEAGELDVQPDLFHLGDMLRAAEQSYLPAARRRGVELRLEVDPDVPEVVRGDEERLREEVLGNLLDNALKFTPAGGEIRLGVRREEGSLLLEVEDDGLGIPPEDLPHIFETYYRSGRGARSAGSGLGLAIVREVAEAHGGRVEAESQPGSGALFRVLLPLSSPEADAVDTGSGKMDSAGTDTREADSSERSRPDGERTAGRAEGAGAPDGRTGAPARDQASVPDASGQSGPPSSTART